MIESSPPVEVASSEQLGLVERLQREAEAFSVPTTDGMLHIEAAAEIERLRIDAVHAAYLTRELNRLHARIEQLRGLCKTAVGWLHDIGEDRCADYLHALTGDAEPVRPNG